MTRLRGTADITDGVISDLRDHDPLVETWLPERQAVYDAWPAEASRYDAQVTVQTVWDGSQNRGTGTRRTVRAQVSIVVTDEWRRDRRSPRQDMSRMLDRCADRLDVACGIGGVVPVGSAGLGGVQEVGDTRLGLLADWRFQYTQIRHPNDGE